jgi:hypothetical protein
MLFKPLDCGGGPPAFLKIGVYPRFGTFSEHLLAVLAGATTFDAVQTVIDSEEGVKS